MFFFVMFKRLVYYYFFLLIQLHKRLSGEAFFHNECGFWIFIDRHRPTCLSTQY